MKHILENTENLAIRQDSVEGLIVDQTGDKPKVTGVHTKVFGEFHGEAVVITSGTFLNGLIHIGENKIKAGRAEMLLL